MNSTKDNSFTRFTRLLLLPLFPLALLGTAVPTRADFPGGFIEQPLTAQIRPRLTAAQIQALLPARGAFTFPAPYHTQAVRVTNASDCGGGDCVWSVGYSYWRNINNHVGSDTLYVFLGLDRNRGGGGPTLFSYHKVTEEVRNLGPLFDAGSALSGMSGEGWYFSATQPTALYVNDGPRMRRYDVLSKQFQTVFDVSSQYGAGYSIWQMHSSDDDRVHSATLRNVASGEMLGCVVYRVDTAQFSFYAKTGEFDECQIDKSGRWLVIKENVDGIAGEDNRIIDLEAGTERVLLDQNGAAGHSDAGHGYMVAADNWNNLPNAQRAWNFASNLLSGSLVFNSINWSAAAANHISHTNARSGVPIDQQYACGSGASYADGPWANEIVCFRLDGSFNVLVVAPVMTEMNSSVGGDDYTKQPKANLDVTGQYMVWASNAGGSRVDAFIAKVPGQLLGGGGPVPSPEPTPLPNTTQSGGGGCALNPTADIDPSFPALLGLAALVLWRRRRV